MVRAKQAGKELWMGLMVEWVEFCVRTKFLGGKIIISMGKSVFNF